MSGCHAVGREFASSRTITQGRKITEEKVLPLPDICIWSHFQVFSGKNYKP